MPYSTVGITIEQQQLKDASPQYYEPKVFQILSTPELQPLTLPRISTKKEVFNLFTKLPFSWNSLKTSILYKIPIDLPESQRKVVQIGRFIPLKSKRTLNTLEIKFISSTLNILRASSSQESLQSPSLANKDWEAWASPSLISILADPSINLNLN